MPSILANQLSGKQVTSTDGQHVGQLNNILVDTESGELETIIIETERTEIFNIERDDDGQIRLPADVLAGVSDHLIITPPTPHRD